MARLSRLCHRPERWIYSIGLSLLLFFFLSELHLHLTVLQPTRSAWLRALLLLAICLLLYVGALFHSSRTGNKRIRRRWMLLFFLLYIYILLNFTLLDRGLGRDGGLYGGMEREEYLRWFVNFRPGKTIYEVYLRGFINGHVGPYYTLLNLLGNLCAMMPLAFFLPLLFSPMKKWYWCFAALLLSAVAVEGMQFLFMIGSCDVDDLLLNVGGAMLLFFLLKIPPLARAVGRLLGEI